MSIPIANDIGDAAPQHTNGSGTPTKDSTPVTIGHEGERIQAHDARSEEAYHVSTSPADGENAWPSIAAAPWLLGCG